MQQCADAAAARLKLAVPAKLSPASAPAGLESKADDKPGDESEDSNDCVDLRDVKRRRLDPEETVRARRVLESKRLPPRLQQKDDKPDDDEEILEDMNSEYPDPVKAVQRLDNTAAKGHLQAKVRLGAASEDGPSAGVEQQDSKRAFAMHAEAATGGDTDGRPVAVHHPSPQAAVEYISRLTAPGAPQQQQQQQQPVELKKEPPMKHWAADDTDDDEIIDDRDVDYDDASDFQSDEDDGKSDFQFDEDDDDDDDSVASQPSRKRRKCETGPTTRSGSKLTTSSVIAGAESATKKLSSSRSGAGAGSGSAARATALPAEELPANFYESVGLPVPRPGSGGLVVSAPLDPDPIAMAVVKEKQQQKAKKTATGVKAILPLSEFVKQFSVKGEPAHRFGQFVTEPYCRIVEKPQIDENARQRALAEQKENAMLGRAGRLGLAGAGAGAGSGPGLGFGLSFAPAYQIPSHPSVSQPLPPVGMPGGPSMEAILGLAAPSVGSLSAQAPGHPYRDAGGGPKRTSPTAAMDLDDKQAMGAAGPPAGSSAAVPPGPPGMPDMDMALFDEQMRALGLGRVVPVGVPGQGFAMDLQSEEEEVVASGKVQ
jgi:hypothetical protein